MQYAIFKGAPCANAIYIDCVPLLQVWCTSLEASLELRDDGVDTIIESKQH